MKKPFINILIPFLIGIIFYYYIEVQSSFLIISFFIMLGMTFVVKNRIARSIIIYIMIFNIAGLLLHVNSSSSEMSNYYGKESTIKVIIKEKVSQNDYSSTYNGQVIKMINQNKEEKLSEKTIVKIRGNTDLVQGTLISGEASIIEPKENTNPGLFNYKRYLQSKGIHSIIEFKEKGYNVLGKVHLSKLEKLKIHINNYVDEFLFSTLDEKNAGIIKAILLGDESLLEEDYIEKYRELGIAHILAISGLHIGIITGFLLFFFKLFNVDYRVSVVITLVFLFVYGYVVGYPPSILRASIILTFLMLSRIIYRRPDYMNIIAFVALILLMYQPLWIFDIGFQLSFVCTIAIVILTPIINNRIFSDIRFGKYISPILAVQIGIAPILIYSFNYITITSFIANLVLIPILSYLLIYVFFTLGLSIPFSQISKLLIKPINSILEVFSLIVEWIHQYLNIIIYLPSISILNILIYYLIIYIIIDRKNLKTLTNKYKVGFVITFIILITTNHTLINYSKWSINFIDVGQGDSALISVRDKRYLIDTGGTLFTDFDVGENILIPYLLKKEIDNIDGVFISHFHEDHGEGLISLLKSPKISIDSIYFSSRNTQNDLYNEIINNAKKKDTKIKTINSKSKLKINNRDEFLLYPPKHTDSEEENNNTLIISLEIDGTKVLFMGDAEEKLEDEFLKYKLKDFDIVKLGHHGSNTSTSDRFLDAIKPEVGIISVGKNSYGHPTTEVLDRLISREIKVYRTDMEGHISIKDASKDFKVITHNYKDLDLSSLDIISIFIIIISLYCNYLYLHTMKHIKERIYDL